MISDIVGRKDAFPEAAEEIGAATVDHGWAVVENRQRFVNGDPELVFLQSRRDVGVSSRIHIGVDPYRDRRHTAPLAGHPVQNLQFSGGFKIKAVDAKFQGPGHFRGLLAHTREHHLGWIATCGHHALQLAHRHDVEAGPETSQ